MNTKKIDDFHKTLLQLILQNKYVANNILMGDKLAACAEIEDDGSLILYTKRRAFKWLCKLFGDYKTISFRELALSLIDTIAGPDNRNNKSNFDGMILEFMDNAIRKGDYEYVIDMLFDVLRVGVKDGEYTSKYLSDSFRSEQKTNETAKIGTFSKIRCGVILNSGESLSDVDLFIKKP